MLVLNHAHKLTRTFPWKNSNETLVTKQQQKKLYSSLFKT